MKKILENIKHPRQEHKRRQAERQERWQGEQQQGESSQVRPPSLTSGDFEREFAAQNANRDSLDSNRSIPRYMLHTTSKSNADNIAQTGLQTSYGGQEGGLSRKRGDQKYVENSQGVVHGTPSRRIADAYADYAGEDRAFIGFRNVHPESTQRDRDSRASYSISKSIPHKQVVPVRPEKVAEGDTGVPIYP